MSSILAGVTSYENFFHKIVKSRWDKSYWQKSMRDQKQQSNRQWFKHRERVGLACGRSKTVLCLQLKWPMQSGMCQCFLVKDMMTHPRRTLGKSISTVKIQFFRKRKKSKWKKAGAKASVKAKSDRKDKKEECGLAFQWHCVCYSTMLHNGWDGRMWVLH